MSIFNKLRELEEEILTQGGSDISIELSVPDSVYSDILKDSLGLDKIVETTNVNTLIGSVVHSGSFQLHGPLGGNVTIRRQKKSCKECGNEVI